MKNMKDLEKALMSGPDSESSAMPSDMMHKAKEEVLKELMHMCKMALMDKTGGDMEEMKKVTVMAPDQEKLAEGLDMAKEMAESSDEDKSEDPSKEMSKEDMKEDVSEGEDPMKEMDDTPLFPGFKKKKMY